MYDVLQEVQETERFKIVYQNIPPWPHHLENTRNHYLNNFINSAVTHYVTKKLDDLDVYIVDIQYIASAFDDPKFCSSNFLCREGKYYSGNAGVEAAQQMLGQFCDTY